MRWARLAESLSPEAADARVDFEVAEGNEPLLHDRQIVAVGFLRRRAMSRARAEAEARLEQHNGR